MQLTALVWMNFCDFNSSSSLQPAFIWVLPVGLQSFRETGWASLWNRKENTKDGLTSNKGTPRETLKFFCTLKETAGGWTTNLEKGMVGWGTTGPVLAHQLMVGCMEMGRGGTTTTPPSPSTTLPPPSAMQWKSQGRAEWWRNTAEAWEYIGQFPVFKRRSKKIRKEFKIIQEKIIKKIREMSQRIKEFWCDWYHAKSSGTIQRYYNTKFWSCSHIGRR